MTTALAERRKGQALTLLLAAAGLIAVAAVTVGIETRASRPDLASGLVVPGLHDSIGAGRRIIITSSDASYRIERAQRGNESVWVMRDRGDYPVLSGRLAALTQGLEQLHFTRRMTTDAAKFERLGVGDPRHGGHGVLVQIEDGRGALLVNLILGTVPTAGQNVVYVRRPDDNQTWAAEGPLPPLRDVASWLNLRPLDLPVERLARVEITPQQGRAYILDRGPDAAWRLTSPPLATPSQISVASAAEAITQLAPVDVQPAPAIQGASVAHLRATTTDGVAIDAELIPSDTKVWIKLVARAVTPGNPAQEAAALAINDRSSAWAYALTPMQVNAVAPPLSALIPATAPSRSAVNEATPAPPSTSVPPQ
ncbi:MAG: DUF4340 domain-containing protein [Proteobacteria bacterium]|nr:DUF4340 domain-containing protein [Pseudomonadota bacterium]